MKRLAITMGDPAGVGPEIIIKAVISPQVRRCCVPLIIGDVFVVKEACNICKVPLKIRVIKSPEESNPSKSAIEIIDMEIIQKRYRKNKPTGKGGSACMGYIQKAVEFAVKKQVDGIVTAPISKEALKMAGFPWPGHTEMLAYFTHTKDYAMMLIGGPLRVILVTIHNAIRDVPHLITKQKVVKTIRLAKKACDMFGIRTPRIAVAGLNPHAGESGMFGDEEITQIIPAIHETRSKGIPVSGPYPPDTVFHKAYKKDVDIVVCMYHDQGLIPLKMIALDKGVNVTVGLPFVRTSPDHGTAYDIAWKGIANPASMIEAIKIAVRLKS